MFASAFKELPTIVETVVAKSGALQSQKQHQQQANQKPPQGPVVHGNYRDVTEQAARPAQPASQPAQPTQQQPQSAQAQPQPVQPETGAIQGLSADTDWFKIVAEVDADELDNGIKDDAGQFVGQLYVLFMDGGAEPAGLLIQLLRDNTPATLAHQT